ncbi:serine threonine protein kinase [Stylonychia lemnae]|uniref:Serine threonine protein kinase n=1 Tax=Stylonychia lemnae TaxID=5949 RepID=A0A077ZYB3_STYLE|nr:serine threonine protein kinase [Stylonychia lemnae]|eukprot:CDW74627.1 serine threonine protein kinase [Stylonychia lemnae]
MAAIGLHICDTNKRYYVIDKHPNGSLGSTYLAEILVDQERIEGGRRVALKKKQFLSIYEQKQFTHEILRLLRENAAFQLRHPNILEIQDAHLNYQNEFVIVSELADSNLEEYIKRKLNDENKSLNISEVAFIMLQLLEGLEFIHNSGFIHRDIRPDNLFVFNDGIIKIGNFDSDFSEWHSQLDKKQGYMAPEVKLGQQYHNKVDIWSLGIVFYYLMTGTSKIKQGGRIIDINRELSNPHNQYLKI